MSVDAKQAALTQLAASCKLPASTLTYLPDDYVALRPPADAKYASVDCLLKKLAPTRGYIRLGFVGNEAFNEEKR